MARSKTSRNVVKFHFIKSNFFRVIRVDGAFGGISPPGTIHMQLYSERAPIPRTTVQPVTKEGLGPEMLRLREVREGFVREVEIDAVMELSQAEALHRWLGEKIQQLNALRAASRPADRSGGS